MKTFLKISSIFFLILFCYLLIVAPNTAFAEESKKPKSAPQVILKPSNLPGPQQPGFSQDAEGFGGSQFQTYLGQFAGKYFPGFLGFIAIAAVFVIIIGGIMFLTAFGDEEKIGTAKKIVQWAIIGLISAMLAYAIIKIILSLPLPTGGEATPAGQSPSVSTEAPS